MSHEKAGLPGTTFQRRPSKFTPDRIQQIRDLIARGETCENIAALIGVTVGTLKVTCSRLGISLRTPRVKLLAPVPTPDRPRTAGGATATLSIRMQYNGQEHDTVLPLTPDMIRQLAFEASSRDQKIAEFAKDLVEAVAQKDLFEKLLADTER